MGREGQKGAVTLEGRGRSKQERFHKGGDPRAVFREGRRKSKGRGNSKQRKQKDLHESTCWVFSPKKHNFLYHSPQAED